MDRPYSNDPKEIFNRMLFIRRVEEAIALNYAEQEMRCPVHLSIGQEGAAVGVCSALEAEDKIVTNHRCHAHYLAMGGQFKAMLAEIYGKASGCCGGRGGSMHLFDDHAGVMGSIPIVAGGIPLAGGIALSKKTLNQKGIAVAFFGDGAVEEGVFHETLNFAKVRDLPILFVCENNQYSVYTSLKDRQPDDNMMRYAEASIVETFRVNGSDVEDVVDATKYLSTKIRQNSSPAFLQVDTYRWLEHCGPNIDDHLGYRNAAATAEWKENCPVKRYQDKILNAKIVSENDLLDMESEISQIIADGFEFARMTDFPNALSAGDNVYAA